eukprot:scaffold26697_cov202-Skeletonema_menzelii.AAC.1
MATVPPKRSPVKRYDADVEHLMKNVLDNSTEIRSQFKAANFYSLRDIYKGLMQDEVRKRIRFKDLDTNEQEVLDDDQYEEVLDLVNYLRYMQNSRGTIVRCLIDVQTMTDRNSFLAFVTLPPSGRGGEADGTVNYDADIALKNEEINKIGAFAPSIIAPGSTSSNNQSASSARGGTTNTSTSSDEEKQLENFKKKFKPSEQTYPELSSDAQYVKWKSLFEAKLKLADLGQIVVSTYTAPVSPPASTAAVELHDRRNLALFTLLTEKVTTDAGISIVLDYTDTEDGIGIWKALKQHYNDDMSAVQRAAFILELISTGTMAPQCKQLEKSVNKFRSLITEYNSYCKPSEKITDTQALTHFERYIRTNDPLHSVRTQLDAQDVLAAAQAMLEGATSHDDPETSLSAFAASMGLGDPDDELVSYEVFYANYSVYAGEQRFPEGHLSKEVWSTMSPHQKRSWIALGRDLRAQLLSTNPQLRAPPPTDGDNVVLPGKGTTGSHGRATNVAFSIPEHNASAVQDQERAMHATVTNPSSGHHADSSSVLDSAIINAMKAQAHSAINPSGGLHSSRRPMDYKHPLDPKRLLSTKNKSPNQLQSIPRKTQPTPDRDTPVRVNSMAITNSSPETPSWSINSALQSAAFPEIPISGSDGHHNPLWHVSMALSTSSRDGSPPGSFSSFNPARIHGLIDGGANGGLANPRKLRLLQYVTPSRRVDVAGVGDSRIRGIRIGTFAGVGTTDGGNKVILIFHEYGELDGTADTIHSKIQLEDGGCLVNDRPRRLNGEQNVITPHNGWSIPLLYRQGLPYLETTYPTNEEMTNLPIVIMTKDTPWNADKYADDDLYPSEEGTYSFVNRDPEYLLLRRVSHIAREQLNTVSTENPAQSGGQSNGGDEALLDDTDTDDEPPGLLTEETDSVEGTFTRASVERHNGVEEAIARMQREIETGFTTLRMDEIKIPKSHEQAMLFDHENGNHMWREAEYWEMNRLFGLGIFRGWGRRHSDTPRVNLHWVYTCKHDGTRKARLTTRISTVLINGEMNLADALSRDFTGGGNHLHFQESPYVTGYNSLTDSGTDEDANNTRVILNVPMTHSDFEMRYLLDPEVMGLLDLTMLGLGDTPTRRNMDTIIGGSHRRNDCTQSDTDHIDTTFVYVDDIVTVSQSNGSNNSGNTGPMD